jgi:transcriptional regulator with XRE-family HTH domain
VDARASNAESKARTRHCRSLRVHKSELLCISHGVGPTGPDATLLTMNAIVARCGANIRYLRVARDLSLSELSRRSGVAKGTLSRLEGGVGNPTVQTLGAIATALDVPYDDLFAREEKAFIARSAEVRTFRLDGALHQVMDRIFGREVVDVVHMTYLAGQSRDAVVDSPGTITRAYVASGRIRIDLPAEALELGPHDFARYATDVPHRYTPRGKSAAHLLLLVTFGSQAWRAGGEDPMQDALRQANAIMDLKHVAEAARDIATS